MDKILLFGKSSSKDSSSPSSSSYSSSYSQPVSIFSSSQNLSVSSTVFAHPTASLGGSQFPFCPSTSFVPKTTYPPKAIDQRHQYPSKDSTSSSFIIEHHKQGSEYTLNNSFSINHCSHANRNSNTNKKFARGYSLDYSAQPPLTHTLSSPHLSFSSISAFHSSNFPLPEPSHSSHSSKLISFGKSTLNTTFKVPEQQRSSSSMDRSRSHTSHHSHSNHDSQSIRSHRSSASWTASEAGRADAMSLARPRTDQEIEDRFIDFMNNMGMHEPGHRKAMAGLSVDNKWKLIYQHESQEQSKAKKREEGFIDKSSPEFYVQKLMADGDLRSTDAKFLLALHVSLKSQPISWVRSFIQCRGQQVLCNALSTLNHRPSRRDADLAMELEIVKSLKTILNNRWGAQEAIKHSSCITSLCFSITSPQLQTRKFVVEVLTFLCYCEVPMGHRLVLEGLDQVKEYWRESARFDAWMRILENTIDGRGRFGTVVYMSEDLKKAGTQDSHLIEYVLSNVVFINALLQVVDDIELRMHLRSQLTTSGLTRIISKMRCLSHDLIDRQLNIFEDEAENDYEDMIECYNHQILNDMSDPYDVFHTLLRSVESSRAYDFFLSLLQHMLLIREEGDLRIRYFQLMDSIITQIVLDRRGVTDNFDKKLGISVNQLVSKLVDQDRLNHALEEARQLRQELELAIRQKNDLELEVGQKDDGMVSQLKANIHSLEDLLRLSRNTIQTLQTKLVDVEVQTQKKLAIQDAQLKHLLRSLQDSNALMAEAGMPPGMSINAGGNDRSDNYPMIDKDKLRKLIEQTKLEGAILQERYGNHLPQSMVLPDPELTSDIESANGFQYGGPIKLTPEILASLAGKSGKGDKSSKGKGSSANLESAAMPATAAAPGIAPTVSGGIPPPPPPPMVGGIPPPPPPPPGGLGGLLGSMMSKGPKIGGGNGSDSEDPPAGSMAAMLAAKKKKLGSSDPTSPKAAPLKAGGGPPPPPPPPPPPGGPGGPPPPPPPPGMKGAPVPGVMMNMNMKKESATAAIKLKALQWDKINYTAVGNTVWGSGGVDESALQKALGESGVFGSMEQLFVAKVTEYKEVRPSKKSQEVCILDQRRSHQINIMLGGIKHTYPEIRHAILRMDENFMTLVQLSNLLKYVPDAEETGRLLEYKDASEDVKLTLGRPEAFFVEMLKVERYQQRLEGLKFKMTFQGLIDSVNESISAITEASKGLKNAKHFKELLNLILMLGNYMNGGGHNGGAFGFKIASINKLVDTKASNAPNMTLLHFLGNIAEKTLPEVLNYQKEIAPCGDACRVSLPELQSDFNLLKVKIKEIKTELHTHYFNGFKSCPEDKFYEVMQPFMDKAEKAFTKAESAMVEMETMYKDCINFYGEDSVSMKPDEFFGIFKTFSASFEKARADNQKQQEKEEQREKAKTAAKVRQEQMAVKKNRIQVRGEGSHDAEGGGDDKGVMDSLLETLRNGGDIEASRRDRRRRNRVDHAPMNVAVKAQDLLSSLREDGSPIALLHE